ncbi:putative baseplate assembly protein [Methylotuvimicrobium sp. KM1]|uniref:putative baseplate assembly protein n=1 Tax=Methylotuvimicrobium sp. KM1 TaxID=3377707 RepID=UPI00384C27FA
MKTHCPDCCYPGLDDPDACGCCEGVEIVTPLSIYNRPGLPEIDYRIGTHGDFLATMTARLTGFYWEEQIGDGKVSRVYPLKGLTTRDAGDPALAFLDAWAVVGDVLTFYQERIANEAYLRTATERRSVLELARLVGYKPRPGVAAGVFLAYTLDDNFEEEVIIPAGSRVQSIPGPDELPQSFETGEDLQARAQWNNLKPRMSRAQTKQTILNHSENLSEPRVYLQGTGLSFRKNEAFRIDFADQTRELFFVREVLPDPAGNRTLVTFSERSKPETVPLPPKKIIDNLSKPASIQPSNRLRLKQNLIGQFALQQSIQPVFQGSRLIRSDLPDSPSFGAVAQAGFSILGAVSSVFKDHLATAYANNKISESKIEVFVLGIKANLFGHNLPLPDENGNCRLELPTDDEDEGPIIITMAVENSEGQDTLALDAEYANITVGDSVAISFDDEATIFSKVKSVETRTLGGPQSGALSFFSTCPTITAIGVATPEGLRRTTVTVSEPIKQKVTVLTLEDPWRDTSDNRILKTTTVFVQTAHPELAEAPIDVSVCGGKDEIIELDGFYDGLKAGRWVIVSGERDDLAGVRFSELAMLSSVAQGISLSPDGTVLPGESPHTFITLAENLAYCFKRGTVAIHGNVVKATHGETRHEVLGSGNGAMPFQSFALKQWPLTHVSSANAKGAESTLKIYVNDLQWEETDSLAALEAGDRMFINATDDGDQTTVTFGNGEKGMRLPSGSENVRARYRSGIGRAGNVRAQQISLLMTKPLGVKEVVNPLRATGGADKETRDQARKNVPLGVRALDRLVSVQDYEDFARVFAGVGKAHAVELSDGRQPLVHVTIAGAEDIPIDENSDLFRNLRWALHRLGDPQQAISLSVRELLMIVIEAGIAILPGYQWEPVATEVRKKLLEAFGFERRELGQDVSLSEILGVMQSVRGVAYVDVYAFGGIPEKIAEADGKRRLLTPDEISEAVACLVTRWSAVDMDAKCAELTAHSECEKYEDCQKYGSFGQTLGVRQRLSVNLADFENGVIRPAQIAFLTPDVPATLILNQIERLP